MYLTDPKRKVDGNLCACDRAKVREKFEKKPHPYYRDGKVPNWLVFQDKGDFKGILKPRDPETGRGGKKRKTRKRKYKKGKTRKPSKKQRHKTRRRK